MGGSLLEDYVLGFRVEGVGFRVWKLQSQARNAISLGESPNADFPSCIRKRSFGPFGGECAQHRPTPRPSLERIRTGALFSDL